MGNAKKVKIVSIYSEFLLFLLVLFFYIYSLAPTVVWGDSAKLSIFSFVKHFSIKPSDHSLHTLIGVVFGMLPWGNFAYSQNFVSAFFGAFAIVILYKTIFMLNCQKISALIGSLALTVSHTFWLLSSITETYTLYAFFLIFIIYLLVLWQEKRKDYLVYIAIFIFCIATFNHLLITISLPVLLYFIVSIDSKFFLRKKNLIFSIISILIGLLPFLIVFISIILEKGWITAIDYIKKDPARIWISQKSLTLLLKESFRYCSFLMYQFPILGFFLGLFGLFKLF